MEPGAPETCEGGSERKKNPNTELSKVQIQKSNYWDCHKMRENFNWKSAAKVIKTKNSDLKQSQGRLSFAFHWHRFSPAPPVIHRIIYLQEQDGIRPGKWNTGKMGSIQHLLYLIYQRKEFWQRINTGTQPEREHCWKVKVAVPLSASTGITQAFCTATDREGGRMWMRQNMQFQNTGVSVGDKVFRDYHDYFSTHFHLLQ